MAALSAASRTEHIKHLINQPWLEAFWDKGQIIKGAPASKQSSRTLEAWTDGVNHKRVVSVAECSVYFARLTTD